MQLKIKKLQTEAVTPKYANHDDAGMDLFSLDEIIINKNQRVQIPTGIAMEIPEGYVGLIWDKSGLSHKYGLKTLGGVIDSGYRGEIKVGMINLSGEDYRIGKGDKVAQMIIQQKTTVDIVEVKELDDKSQRGDGGFGSTGK
jgi:dUTP pyrophosphatase